MTNLFKLISLTMKYKKKKILIKNNIKNLKKCLFLLKKNIIKDVKINKYDLVLTLNYNHTTIPKYNLKEKNEL